jgi:hypothetical protein
LLETTDWNAYGRQSGNPKCQDCMVHCGYEPTAVAQTFGSLRGLLGAARFTLLGPPREQGPVNDDPVSVARPPVLYQLPQIHQLESGTRDEPEQVPVQARAG